MDSFSTVEIMFEFSKAIRHSLIAIESLHDLQGIDQGKVNVVAASVRQAHQQGTAYLASLIGTGSVVRNEVGPDATSLHDS